MTNKVKRKPTEWKEFYPTIPQIKDLYQEHTKNWKASNPLNSKTLSKNENQR